MAKKETANTTVPDKLVALFTVVKRGKGEIFKDLIENFGVNFQLEFYGKGTASTHIDELLGLGDLNKDVILSVVDENKVNKIIDSLNDKFALKKSGGGISFAVPMKSVIGVFVYNFLADHRLRRTDK